MKPAELHILKGSVQKDLFHINCYLITRGSDINWIMQMLVTNVHCCINNYYHTSLNFL